MASLFNDGQSFEMAPLSDFTVTFKDHTKSVELPEVDFTIWLIRQTNVNYEILGKELFMNCSKPTDVNPVLSQHDIDLGYTIVWQPD